MTDSKAQGAMEYLMSYGWAIVIVVIAGLALWSMGIVNLGDSTPARSTGFQAIKPILSTCEIGNHSGLLQGGKRPGFNCVFLNGVADNIRIRNVTLTFNIAPWYNRHCQHMGVIKTSEYGFPNPYKFTYWSCEFYMDSCFNGDFCYDEADPVCPTTKTFLIPAGSTFKVFTSSPIASGGDPCKREFVGKDSLGKEYEVEIDIEYLIDVGGIMKTQRSSGTIILRSNGNAEL